MACLFKKFNATNIFALLGSVLVSAVTDRSNNGVADLKGAQSSGGGGEVSECYLASLINAPA